MHPNSSSSPLLSVTCFGRLLTRAVGTSSSVPVLTARLLGERSAIRVEAAVFAAARAEGEKLARQRHGTLTRLSDVAYQVAELLGLGPDGAAAVEAAEIEVERLLARPVPAAVRQLTEARGRGARIAFECDTLLPRAVVEELLDSHGLRRAEDVVRLASEPGGEPPAGGAATSTARGGPWPEASLDRYERVLDEAALRTGGLSSVMAGASRRARLILQDEAPEVPAPLVEVSAGVAGPLLAGYVLWCAQRAREAGCRRLYFVSRDGEVLLRLARRLLPAVGLDLDVRYLEGNRRAWLLPGMTTVDVESVVSVAGRGEVTTVRDLLIWVRMQPEALAGPLERAGFPSSSWDDGLRADQVRKVLAVLTDPAVEPSVRRSADDATEDAGRYLRQVGLLDDEPYAIVDMEGHGNVGRLLAPLVRKVGGRPPAVEFYFALVSPGPPEGRQPLGYMYDDGRGTGVHQREDDLYVALEVFTAGAHGQVLGYETAGGVARAVLAEERNASALRWGLGDLRRVLDVFADELATSLSLVDVRADVRTVTWQVLTDFWTSPTAAEVAVWGTFPFPGGRGDHPIATGFSTREVARSVIARRPRMRRRGTWPAGVRMNAPWHLRSLQRGLDRRRRREFR